MSKRKKSIAIVGWTNTETQFYGVTKPYLEYFKNYGDVYILTPSSSHRVFPVDLLVLPGGRDVNPTRYQQVPSYWTGTPDPFLEYFDEVMLPKYIERKIPIFGICRGLQTLGVHFGLPLMQHIDGFHEKSVKHRGELVHDIYRLTDQITTEKFKEKDVICKTNSLHHQAITLTDMLEIENDLTPIAITKDWLVEAIAHKTLPIAAVQYHPEEIYDKFSEELINGLLKL